MFKNVTKKNLSSPSPTSPSQSFSIARENHFQLHRPPTLHVTDSPALSSALHVLRAGPFEPLLRKRIYVGGQQKNKPKIEF